MPRAVPAPVAVALALAVTACQSGTEAVDSGQPASRGPNATEGPGPVMTVGPPPSPTDDDSRPAVIDPALLEYLPAAIGGIALTEAPDEAALALADPDLDTIASALDVGLAVDQATGNLVTAHVVRLRPGAFGDATYRQWRDTFDEGACAAAGGVEGRLEVDIAERPVFVTSCVRDLRTYHAWIPDEEILISASSVGAARFGEQLMAGLRVAS